MTGRGRLVPVVLIASGVAGLLERWRRAIPEAFAVDEVAEWSALDRRLAARQPIIALLLDLHLPNLGGLRRVVAIQRRRPETKIVILTDRPDEREGAAALKMGAHGYCDRNIDHRLLGKALQVLRRKEIWAGRKIVAHVLDELTALTEQKLTEPPADLNGGLDGLSPRERTVVHFLCAGATDAEIATMLSLTGRTVKAHVTAALRKLGISNRLQLVLLVLNSQPTFAPGADGRGGARRSAPPGALQIVRAAPTRRTGNSNGQSSLARRAAVSRVASPRPRPWSQARGALRLPGPDTGDRTAQPLSTAARHGEHRPVGLFIRLRCREESLGNREITR